MTSTLSAMMSMARQAAGPTAEKTAHSLLSIPARRVGVGQPMCLHPPR